MKPIRMLLAALTVLSLSAGVSFAQTMPSPGPAHAWLQQFVGEWETETEAMMEPGKPPMKTTGTETVRPLGQFWTVSEIKSTMMDKPFMGNLTLGYDAEKQKYVGTWVDSMTGKLWEYEGTVDATGNVLTLETEGMCPMMNKMTRFKEVIEVKNKDHKVFSSSIQMEDGSWVTMMTSHARRLK
jgi:hypothetical protein